MSPHPDVVANPIPRELVHRRMDEIEAAEGAELLEDVARMVRRYVMAGPEQIDTLTLWIVHTHAMKAFYTTGRLYITSPEANCGKTVALSVVGALVANPMVAVNISPAAMYRSIEQRSPTFLLDEVDKSITGKGAKDSESCRELLSVLNSGYKQGQTVARCVGPKFEVKDFPTFAPVAMAGILAGVDQPFMTRSIPILLQRCMDHDDIEAYAYRRGVAEEFSVLRDRIARWAGMHFAEIEACEPALPPGLEGRQLEVWEALLQIAAVCGWLPRAHAACEKLTLFEKPGAETPAWEMLRDTQRCFRLDDEGFVATTVLIERLHNLEDSDWQHWNFGKGLTAKSLAKLLGQYGVEPVVRRRDGEQRRGYDVTGKLAGAWVLYVDPVENAKEAQEIERDDVLPLFSLSTVTDVAVTDAAVSRDGKPLLRDATDDFVTGTSPVTDVSQNGTHPSQPVDDPSHDDSDPSQDDFYDGEPF